MREEYEQLLERAKKRLSTLLKQYDKAGVATEGDYENMIAQTKRKIKTYETLLQEEERKEEAIRNPSQATIYCYVFTSTFVQIQHLYSSEEQAQLPHQRYGEQEADWQPFYANKTSIAHLLATYQAAYPLQIVYWKSAAQQYIDLDNHLQKSKALAVLDWMALQNSNIHGFLKFDNQRTPFVAPICEQTRLPFKARLRRAQSNFPTINALRAQGLSCEMGLFDSSSQANFKQDLHRLFNKLSSNVHNKSQDNSFIRGMNMNLL